LFKEKEITASIKSETKVPLGFRAGGIHCGIKKSRKDLALIVSELPATAAAVFTLNKVQAAPVLASKMNLSRRRYHRAIIVNSGNANACTGDNGYIDAVTMLNETASEIGAEPEEIFVASTGVIGEQLPIGKIVSGIHSITPALSRKDFSSAAEAIMTTDTFRKCASSAFIIDGVEVTIYGMAKGSGMIHPNMATMLGFVLTDAAIDKNVFQALLKKTSDRTFNRIIVDGDTSTNDMVVALANGASGAAVIREKESYRIFEEELYRVLKKLSIDIVKDGEGATKLIEVKVEGAESDEDAVKAARTIALSPLVKTAFHGEDANWGRIIAAAGYSGIEFDPAKFEIFINSVQILEQNYKVTMPNAEANATLKPESIELLVRLNGGNGTAGCWTCDFSEEYVRINGSYRS
jgi:glutamate N-acetyltransferase/amino-acid N-acetyltransferase